MPFPAIRRRRADRLAPARRLRPPRPAALLRTALVAALLLTAAAVLYHDDPAVPRCRAETPGRPAARRTPDDPAASTAHNEAGGVGGRLPVPAGLAGVPVRVAEPAALAVLRPGDRVDLHPAGGDAGGGALEGWVLGVADEGPILLVALVPADAARLAARGGGVSYAVIVRAGQPTPSTTAAEETRCSRASETSSCGAM